MHSLRWIEEAKKRAALEAATHVKDGYIVGLGTGSTAEYAIEELGRRIREEGLSIKGVPTSLRTEEVAKRNGIPLTTLDENPIIDVAIDGADQIDWSLNLIKGRGGALTREKIVDSAAREFIVVADERKLVNRLGEGGAVIPVEVLPLAARPVMEKLRELGGEPVLRMADGEPFKTDNNNFIVDVKFGAIENIKDLNARMKSIPGVIETGLFIDMADIAYIGCRDGVRILKRKS